MPRWPRWLIRLIDAFDSALTMRTAFACPACLVSPGGRRASRFAAGLAALTLAAASLFSSVRAAAAPFDSEGGRLGGALAVHSHRGGRARGRARRSDLDPRSAPARLRRTPSCSSIRPGSSTSTSCLRSCERADASSSSTTTAPATSSSRSSTSAAGRCRADPPRCCGETRPSRSPSPPSSTRRCATSRRS